MDMMQRAAFISAMAGGVQPTSVESPHARVVRRHLLPMLVLTLGYLMFELGFNARLLDVVGGDASLEEVSSIERWGRIISGVAATLIAWNCMLSKAVRLDWTPRKTIMRAALWAALIMPLVYWGEKAIIDNIVEDSDGATRRAAAHLRAVTTAAVQGSVAIDGIDLSPELARAPEGKSFLALLPMITLSTDELEAKTEKALRTVLETATIRAIGTAEQSYNDVFVASAKAIAEMYNEGYLPADRKYKKALADTPRRQQEAWDDYQRDLKARHSKLTPTNVPLDRHEEVRSRLLKKGLNLPKGWHPADRGTFEAAVAEKVRRDAKQAFADGTKRELGFELPPDLPWKSFVAHPSVQARWREKVGAPKNVTLSPDMSVDAWRARIWRPEVDKRVSDALKRLLAPAASYADGGANADDGRRAMESLVVPPIALAISLLGALLHVMKTTKFALGIIVPQGILSGRVFWIFRRRSLVIAFIAALPVIAAALYPFSTPNEVSTSRVFSNLQAQTAEKFSPAVATAARWVVQAQPWFYPVNEKVRQGLLFGFGFGYADEGETKS